MWTWWRQRRARRIIRRHAGDFDPMLSSVIDALTVALEEHDDWRLREARSLVERAAFDDEWIR